MRRGVAPALLLASALAACTAPDVPVRGIATDPVRLGLAGAPAGPVIADRWWTALGDPQLDRIVDEALAGNPSLDAALARVARAESVVRASGVATEPQAALATQAQVIRLSGRYTIPPPIAGSTRTIGQAVANLQWTLDLFGRYRSAVRQARDEATAARLDVAAARLALAGSVASAYLDLARAEQQAGVAARALRTREGAVRLTQVQVRNGLAAKLDARAGDVLVAEARQAVVRARARRDVAVHALAALAGRGQDYYASIGPARLRFDAALPLPDRLPADLLDRRPDLAAARTRIAAAEQGRTAAIRAWKPDVNLLGLVGFQAVGIDNLFSPDALTGGPGIGLNLPLLDGGRRRADLESAVAQRNAAVADYNNRALAAVRDTADAITRIRAADADRVAQRDTLAALTDVGRLNNVRVNSGLSSRLDLVDNDVRLLAAEQNLADIGADALLARVQLVQALGGGFLPEPQIPAPETRP